MPPSSGCGAVKPWIDMRIDRNCDQGKILIVDDEKSIRVLLKRMLDKNGYACVVAASVRDAKEIIKGGQNIALILCDIQMPGESGLELVRHVASQYPEIAVVMVTVIEDQETADMVSDMGVYGYILKPFDQNQIRISVANAMRRRELEKRERFYLQYLEETVKQTKTEVLEANDALVENEAELRARKNELEEINSALRVLLEKRDQDKAALEENVVTSVKRTVEPFLERLKRTNLAHEQKHLLDIVESNIKRITSPFIKDLSSSYLNLSPAEIEIAGLIKHGRTTKEIAYTLHVSENTVMSHRYKIRRKLGLLNKKENLHTYLHRLADQ